MRSVLESEVSKEVQERSGEAAGSDRTRQRVTGTAKIPAGVNKWKYSCANVGKKKSFSNFLLLKQSVIRIHMTFKDEIVHSEPRKNMEGKCSHEEANTGIVVHLMHYLQKYNTILIRRAHTVLIILLCNFYCNF